MKEGEIWSVRVGPETSLPDLFAEPREPGLEYSATLVLDSADALTAKTSKAKSEI